MRCVSVASGCESVYGALICGLTHSLSMEQRYKAPAVELLGMSPNMPIRRAKTSIWEG